MNVLSLFDGISCGQIALNRCCIDYNNYFASEIYKPAIKVTTDNYPNTVHLGDVTKIKGNNLPTIDLLIGGSPCQGFSFAGKQLNFEDKRSKLFFEFVRLLEECKPKYFLLENVRMKKKYEQVITQLLCIEPIEINSALFSAQDRKRLYWTNILVEEILQQDQVYLKNILEEKVNREFFLKQTIADRYIPITSFIPNLEKSCVFGKLSKYQGDRVFDTNCKASSLSAFGGNNGGGSCNIIWDKNKLRRLTPLECERLQTIPENYTKMISKNQRYKCIGDGWTVNVIVHIFKGLLLVQKRNKIL